MNPKVYIVIMSRGFDDYHIMGVYVSEKVAKEYIASHTTIRDRGDYHIEEYAVEG